MKLYTSYWAQVRNFPNTLVGLNTTIWPPRWRPLGKDKNNVLVIDCFPLKPGSECSGLCNGKCDPKHPENCKFLETYHEQLKHIDFNHFKYQLQKLHDDICMGENLKDVDFAFLVYETPKNLCSERIAIQKWFHENGMKIEEWHK